MKVISFYNNNLKIKAVLLLLILILLGVSTIMCFTNHKKSQNTLPMSSVKSKNTISLYNDFKPYKPYMMININYHNSTDSYVIRENTVGNVLNDLKIKLNSNDNLSCNLDEKIIADETITINKIEYTYDFKTEIIPFEKEVIKDSNMLEGETKVIQSGENGKQKFKFKNTYCNDEFLYSQKYTVEYQYPKNEIIRIGTKDIIENDIAEEVTDDNKVLLKTKYDDDNFKLNKVKLSDSDRDLLERLLTGEFGGSYIGSCLVAQSIKCAIVYDNYTSIKSLIKGMGYVGSTNMGKSQNAVEAVKFIFDKNGLAVKHRLFYMYNPKLCDSAFHESQNYILTYQDVRFFDRW
ncbi:MAG: G5 domain-containing protein [Clostridia bacterium]|nr:G5 domain-containing protein [Clostridia bacterium]